jgi:hypothetical protein
MLDDVHTSPQPAGFRKPDTFVPAPKLVVPQSTVPLVLSEETLVPVGRNGNHASPVACGVGPLVVHASTTREIFPVPEPIVTTVPGVLRTSSPLGTEVSNVLEDGTAVSVVSL